MVPVVAKENKNMRKINYDDSLKLQEEIFWQ